jgi:autoinducer 2 (AI-2) kinase
MSPTPGRIACFRAIEENAAYVSRAHLRIVAEVTGLEPEEVVFTGGGARGALWPQILADVLGLPVRLPVVKESTALGAALLAGVGAGVYGSVAEAAARVARFERTVEPDPQARYAYEALFDQWEAVYARSLSLSEDGLLRGMWRAAGT